MKKEKTDNIQRSPLEITDAIWDRIQPVLADCPKVHVGNPEKCRLFLSAVLWIAKEGVPWSALPDRYGNWRTIYQRFINWCDAGVFESLQAYFHTDIEIPTILSAFGALYAKMLKARIRKSLKSQGFKVNGDQISLPDNLDKEKIRNLHAQAVHYKIEERKKCLIKHEPFLLQQFASGEEVVPDKIAPKLIEVHSGSKDELLFRYASLHWKIPVSSGYGRRLRFLVVDQHTDKLIGLFGLGDPVFSLRNRDQWIGWDKEDRNERLHHVVDAYVLGAVPPYSFLMGGKLIALLATSNEVREAFKRKYQGRTSVIRKRKQAGEIALITTTSALGSSSLYNRLKFQDRLAFQCVGYTKGFGAFHFSNGIYNALTTYAKSNATATASHELWGKGFRNRKEVVQKTLAKLGLPPNWINHGINREIYVAPLANNTCAFLRGDVQELNYYDQPVTELFNWFQEEKLLPRSERDKRYKEWEPQEWKLWESTDAGTHTIRQTNVSVSQHRKKKIKADNDEKECQQLVAKAINKRQMLENAFNKHSLSKHLTYKKFIDECVSKRRAFTTTSRSYAISDEAIKGYSNYLKGIRSIIADFEMLIKAINHGDKGAVWIRNLLDELKSEVTPV